MVAVPGPSPSTAHGVYNSVAPTAADQQAMPLQVDSAGRLITTGGGTGGVTNVLPTTLNPNDLTAVALNISTATTTTVVTAGAGSVTTRVHRLRMFVAGANTITINGAVPEVVPFTGPGALLYDFDSRPWFTTAAATAFTITTTTTAAVTGTVEYLKS